MPKLGLILTAAGQSRRFQSQENKTLSLLCGKPAFLHSLERFLQIQNLVSIIITTDSEKTASEMKKHLPKTTVPIQFILGGETRQISVQNGFQKLPPVDQVLIHDAARPNLTQDLLNRILNHGKTAKAVIPGIPVVDTIKRVKNGLVVETPPRDELVAVQTPQLFDYEILKEAYKAPNKEATDEGMLIEALKHPVCIVKGDVENLKLTHPQDLERLENYLSSTLS